MLIRLLITKQMALCDYKYYTQNYDFDLLGLISIAFIVTINPFIASFDNAALVKKFTNYLDFSCSKWCHNH